MPWSACAHAAQLDAIRTKPHRSVSAGDIPRLYHARFLPLLIFQHQDARGYYAVRLCPTKQTPGRVHTAGGRATYREMCRHLYTHIYFLLDLRLQLLLKLLLLSRSAHSPAVRFKIPHPLRTARVPTIELSSRGFSCCCTCQPPQGYQSPCAQLRLHHWKLPTMMVQQPSMLHRRWAAINAHRTLIVPRLG